MRLTTVGTGTAAPHPSRVAAGHLVAAGDVRLLLDCGGGIVHRMAALGLDWMGITHVAITHFDADHVSDLAPLLIAWRYGALPPRAAPVTLIGPPGFSLLLERLATAFGSTVRAPGYPVIEHELNAGEPFPLAAGVTLEAHRVPHTTESVAYSVRALGRRIVYTGDTGYDDALGEWARGCDVLLSECSLPRELAIPTHLTPETCALLAARSAPEQLVLTHFYPPVEAVDIRSVVAERYSGPVVLAVDGWSVDLEER